MFGLGMQELVVIGIVAVLLFGKRLPEVARSMGKSYNEFRKGLGEIQSSMDYTEPYGGSSRGHSSSSGSMYDDYEEMDEPTVPKFEPPSSEPIQARDSVDSTSAAGEGSGMGGLLSGGGSTTASDSGVPRGGSVGPVDSGGVGAEAGSSEAGSAMTDEASDASRADAGSR